MAPKAAKKEPKVSAAEKRRETQEKRALKERADQQALAEWIDTHDPLLDKAADTPIQLEELFSSKLVHRTFAQPGVGDTPYDWTEFRKVLAERSATSPRWFIQLREEDLLAGAEGMEGVTVDCYVIAEAAQPTLAPAEYIVKVHWPYSDAEDNAPERILPLESQEMCWRRVVKADGSDMNVYLLQKRHSDGAAKTGPALASSAFGFGASAPSASSPTAAATTVTAPSADAPSSTAASTATSSLGFGFGAAPTANGAPTAAAASGFGFSFGPAIPTSAPSAGNGSSTTTTAFSFGFGQSSAAPAPPSFGFGAPAAPSTAPAPAVTSEVKVEPLKTSEILFALWSRRRLTDLAKEIRSGSRIVREDFPLDASTTMKLVMQNDRKDDVATTTRRLLLNRLFAKQDPDVRAMDKWIDDCPVYDEALAPALQAFRERQLNELAEESEVFHQICERYHGKIEEELRRIVKLRLSAADAELDRIAAITEQIKEHKLAEKSAFRLLKFYAKNDVLRFRPFGKISGISEMGESVDVCVPPAHVNINPFTGKPL
ncbi:hypothetical protein ABB37_04433 [Leptomonas pyrrhocoris]|uniref:Nucleoporin n=1 Tax=Leptomonas pyrrhocoris TaxID=157538 RepID=A0A0N0DVZ4_LEPPY|nr:hypothetical protein ABB37_04433 [Leptomonas pyrrhocoris]KPA81072.1 hypothetical protein ABB37_04433 [Leptomonas pyrrhocoris]|eukprot:XP_015659511.1 hypothetical protein ABB37_04433 [Leptomonas pyrrhocoris]